MKMIKITPIFEKKDVYETNRDYGSMLINVDKICSVAVNIRTCKTEILFERGMIPVAETPEEIEEMINGKGNCK